MIIIQQQSETTEAERKPSNETAGAPARSEKGDTKMEESGQTLSDKSNALCSRLNYKLLVTKNEVRNELMTTNGTPVNTHILTKANKRAYKTPIPQVWPKSKLIFKFGQKNCISIKKVGKYI